MATKEELKKALEDRIKLAESLADFETDSLDKKKRGAELLELEIRYMEEYGELTQANLKDLQTRKKLLEHVTEEIQDQVDALSDVKAGTDAVDGAVKGILEKSIVLSGAWDKGFVGAISKSKKPLRDVFKAISKNVTATNFLGSTVMAVVETTMKLAFAADTASANLNRITGQGKSYAMRVHKMAAANRMLGLSEESVGEAMGVMYQEFSQFSRLSQTQQDQIALHAAKLERFGVSSSTTAANYESLITSFKMSPKAAEQTINDLTKLAQAIDMPPEQMQEGMRSSMPVLSKWGKESRHIFAKTAIHAKKLGVSFDTLINLGDQFDTFEGAASAVGKLNALVGGDVLNAYDMMNMSLDERNMAVKRAVELDGESWGSMHRLKQVAYANAAGITDMEEAHRLFGGASADSMSVEEKRAKTQMKLQKGMNKALNKTMTIMEEFEAFIKTLFGSTTGVEWATQLREGFKKLWPQVQNFVTVGKQLMLLASAWIGGKMAGGLILGGGKGIGKLWGGMKAAKSMATGSKMFKALKAGKGAGGFMNMMRTPGLASAGNLAAGPLSMVGGGPSKMAKLGKFMKGGKSILGGAAAKSLGKKIPGIGAVLGLGFMAQRLMKGDFVGGGLEALSGIASILPGWGTAASVGIDATLAARDMKGTSKKLTKAKGNSKAASGNSQFDALTKALTTAINNAQGREVILQLDGNEVGRFTEKHIGNKYGLMRK